MSTEVSKYLAYLLRHRPQAAGLVLDGAGWVEVDALLAALAAQGRALTPAQLEAVVNAPGKRRFELDGGRIRAAQGHSVAVELGLHPTEPPTTLYHGTVARFLDRILREGLLPRGRTHVHLSPDVATAREVGARRGEPVILTVDAAAAWREGHAFLLAASGVWLTDHVPPRYLSVLTPARASD